MRHFFTLLLLALGSLPTFAQDGDVANRSAAPVVSFEYTVHKGCDGDTLILSNNTKPGTGSYRFIWNFGDGTAADGEHTNPIHVYTAAGDFQITLTYTNANDETQTYSVSRNVTSNHPATAAIQVIPASSVCWQVPMTFTTTSQNNQKTTASWNMGDGNTTANPADYVYTNPGEYKVKVTITDELGCKATKTTTVQVVKITAYTATHDTDVCLKDPMPLHAYAVVEPSSIPYTIEWSPSENISNKTSVDPLFKGVGDYVYTVTANTSIPFCMATDTVAIHSYQPVTLTDVTASQTIQAGSILQLNASGADYYAWLPKNGTISNANVSSPIVAPADSITKYMVYGMSEAGCLDSAAIVITTTGTNSDIVPSAFTPNGDGLNDIFRITNNNFAKLVDFSIFDRRGHVVFKTNNQGRGWDGNYNGAPQDMGVFSYQITIIQHDGINKTYKGNVTLIR